MLRYHTKKRHSKNTHEVISAAFPACFVGDLTEVLTRIPVAHIEPHTDDPNRVNIGDLEVFIPSRVYFPAIDPRDFADLSDTQNAMIAAIYTRHHSGFQREIWAGRLLNHPAPWTSPFLALLLGDYVIEVIARLERGLTEDWEAPIRDFATSNPKWRQSLNDRILTYWDIYYRHKIPRIFEYPGYRLAHKLGLWDKKTAPKLIRKSNKSEMATTRKPSDQF